MRRIFSIAVFVLCALVVGGVPGAALRPIVVVLTAPPLPVTVSDRDALLDVTLRTTTHTPLGDARVQALAMIDGRAFLAGEAHSDAAGHATIRDLPRGECWVLADAPLRSRASASVVLVAGARALEMDLGDEHLLAVDVKDEQGVPIEAAEIEIAGQDPLPVGARTDKSGRAHVGRLGLAPWIVTARARGYEEIVHRGVREGEALRVTLRRLGALLVTVLGPENAPAAGARVIVGGASLWPARSAETNKDGTVRIGALAAGSYAMRATAGDLASPIELSIPLARGEERAVTLQLGLGVRVAVRVTDDANGPGIFGARVTLAEAGLSPFPLEATTDRDGRASLGPVAKGGAVVSARADGFVARGAVTVPEPLEGEIKVALVRAGTIVGRVVDRRGFPVDGATIELVGTDFQGAPIDDDPRRTRFREAHFDATLHGPTPLIAAGELGVMPGPVPAIPHGFSTAPSLPQAQAGGGGAMAKPAEPWITRDDGTFRATPASPGRVRALVRHPQYVEAMSEIVTLTSGGEARVEIVMHTGGTLEGRVLDVSGRPVAGARVAIAAARGSMERATKSATDGSFAFAAMPEEITVMVSKDEGTEDDATAVLARLPVSIPEGGRKEITLTLPDARPVLDARVTDERGFPLQNVQINAASLDPASPMRCTAFTNARGEARLAGARGLPLRVEARAPSWAPQVVTTGAERAGLLITMTPSESAKGEVRTAAGRGDPIAEAEVVLYTELGARHTRTDRDGSFAFAELAPGAARVRVRAPGFAPKEASFTVDARAGRRAFAIPRVELTQEGIVEGLVLDAKNNPVQGARVAKDSVPVYLAVGATPRNVAVTDARGHFRLAELAEGTITLEAYAPDVGRARAESVRVIAGRSTDFGKITLQRSADEKASDPGASGGVAVTLGETGGEPHEVVIVMVAEASEAERVGLAPGDVVIELDGKVVRSMADARTQMSGPVGDDVVIKLRRLDKSETLRVPREQVRR